MARSKATSIVLERIDAERESRGISKRELSQNAGFGAGYIWELLSSDKEPSFGGVMAMIDALGVPAELVLLGQAPGAELLPGRPKHKEIGDRLIFLRLSTSDMSAEAWARSHKLPLARYLLWESGHERIELDSAKALVEALGVTLDWIYLGNPTSDADPRPGDLTSNSA